MAKIKSVSAREILDSRASPTVEVMAVLDDNSVGVASCPSGTSVGKYEALELRDNDPARYHGMGVLKAIKNIHEKIMPRIIGMEANNQSEIDKAIIDVDGSQNKSILGSNATLPVSIAVCKAAAKSNGLLLFSYISRFVQQPEKLLKIPTPLFNVINGGKHAGNKLNFQEFMVIPASSNAYEKSLTMGTGIYQSLFKVLERSNLSTLVGFEGGFGPVVAKNSDALVLLKQAIDDLNIKLGLDVFFGLDAAASTFYKEKAYHIRDKQTPLSPSELISFYEELNNTYHLLYLEDPLEEDDWDSWATLLGKLSQNTLIVGDDLTATNPLRLQTAINKKAINGIIVKPNQIGTVIETIAVVEIARQAGIKIIVSHRSGETNDDFIADFAVGVSADYVKCGAPARGERVAKYNRLLQIEQEIKQLESAPQ